jgi:hypothetical protein
VGTQTTRRLLKTSLILLQCDSGTWQTI